jgi:thioredoxin 1
MIKNMDVNAPVSKNLIILRDVDFKKQIKTGVTLVDFWAPWCMPCKIQGPIVSEVADELAGKAAICKLNIDENKKTAAELGIKSIPTILIFKNGKIVKKMVGVKTKAVLVKAVKEQLS